MIRILRRWRADEDGSIAVETLMMVPLMVWAFLSTMIYFDAYRTESIAQKASLTIADMFSRETTYIDNNYMDGARDLLRFLTLHDSTPGLRVTVFRFYQPDPSEAGEYRRVWSRNRGGVGNLTGNEVKALAHRFPIMVHGERGILVQTWTQYDMRYNVMFVNPLESFEIETFNVISPRFAPTLCWTPDASASDPTASERC